MRPGGYGYYVITEKYLSTCLRSEVWFALFQSKSKYADPPPPYGRRSTLHPCAPPVTIIHESIRGTDGGTIPIRGTVGDVGWVGETRKVYRVQGLHHMILKVLLFDFTVLSNRRAVFNGNISAATQQLQILIHIPIANLLAICHDCLFIRSISFIMLILLHQNMGPLGLML
jgi:hypothetical protein